MISLKKTENLYVLFGLFLSFLIPIVIMSVVYSLVDVYPFGQKSLLMYWDIREQYSNYFEYFKNMFHSNNDVIYSFSKTLGGSLVGLFAYYLASPFNFLFVILGRLKIVDIILILTLLKIGLCGFTFSIFLNYKKKFDIKSLMFSTSYALMAYNIIYQQNIMWIDGVIWLPMIVLGIKKILNEDDYSFYIIFLFISIFSNYYIGYMIGIFSILYFIFELIAIDNLISNFKEVFRNKILKFFGATILSVGLDAFFLIPTLTSLEGSKGPQNLLDKVQFFESDILVTNENKYVFNKNFCIVDFFSKFFTGAFEWQDVMSGFPLVFCGLGVFILALLYFFNDSIKLKKRISKLSLLLIMFFSCYFSIINNFWHGFNPPTGFPFRYSFLISFLIICISYENINHLDQYKNRIIKFIAVSTFLVILLFGLKSVGYMHLKYNFAYHLILLLATFLLIYFIKTKYNLSYILLAITILFDLGANGYYCLRQYNFTDIYEFDRFIKENRVIYDKIGSHDKGFYRIEKTFHRTRNDNMLFNANGATHYSSSEKDFIKDFVSNLGLEKFGKVYASYGIGGTMTADSLLGIKYLISYYRPNEFYRRTFDAKIYENPFVLPISFAVDKSVCEVMLDEDNKFENQNRIFESMTGEEMPIFKRCENVKFKIENMRCTNSEWGDMIYHQDDSQGDAYLSCQLTVLSENPIYFNFNSSKFFNAFIKVNDKPRNFNLASQAIYCLGTFKKGSVVDIKLYPKNKYLYMKNTHFYYEDVSLLDRYTKLLKEQTCQLEKITSSHLKGSINVKSNDKYLIFSIPYEDEWKITLDGKKCEKHPAFGALLSIPISKGEHIVEMRYLPKGFFLGLLISFLSLSSLTLIVFVRKFRNRKKI